MSSISNFFYSDSKENMSAWQMIGESAQGVVVNSGVAALSFCTGLGAHMMANGLSNNYFNPAQNSISDLAINTITATAAAFAGGYVGECVGYSAIPLASWAGVSIDPAWIGLMGATAASVTSALAHHTRESAPVKKGKKS